MRLADLEDMDCDFLIPSQVAEILHCKPHEIRIQAHLDPTALGYPVNIQGTRIRIPRLGFLAWAKGEIAKEDKL